MAELVGRLLFGIIGGLAGDLMNSIIHRTSRKLAFWLGTKFSGRTAIVVGLLVGLAAAGFFPMVALLLPH